MMQYNRNARIAYGFLSRISNLELFQKEMAEKLKKSADVLKRTMQVGLLRKSLGLQQLSERTVKDKVFIGSRTPTTPLVRSKQMLRAIDVHEMSRRAINAGVGRDGVAVFVGIKRSSKLYRPIRAKRGTQLYRRTRGSWHQRKITTIHNIAAMHVQGTKSLGKGIVFGSGGLPKRDFVTVSWCRHASKHEAYMLKEINAYVERCLASASGLASPITAFGTIEQGVFQTAQRFFSRGREGLTSFYYHRP